MKQPYVCAVCRKPFYRPPSAMVVPEPVCSNRCKFKQQSARRRGFIPPAAREAATRLANARMQARLKGQFGTLSDRERDLFRFVWKLAYQRGYNRAYFGRRATRDREAAA